MSETAMVNPDRTPVLEIDLNLADPAFKDEVAGIHGGERIRRCYACGVCSARCPVSEHLPEFDPRRFIRLVLLGQKQDLLASPMLWRCSTCFTCLETCPQQVGFTDVLFALKNLARLAGYCPPALAAQTDLLRNHGRLYEITDFENKNRQVLGLPALTERPEHFAVILKAESSASGGER